MPEWVASTIIIAVAIIILLMRRLYKNRRVCHTCRHVSKDITEPPCWHCYTTCPDMVAWEQREDEE